MSTTILNTKTLFILLAPIFFLMLSHIKHPKFYGNTRLWAILFHLAFSAKIILLVFAPHQGHLDLGFDMLMVSILLTITIFLKIDEITLKKVKTIWKIPVVGSLLGLSMPPLLGELVAIIVVLIAAILVFDSRRELYLVLKPILMLSVIFIAFKICKLTLGFSTLTILLGLISYVSAVRIIEIAIIKEWAKSIESI